MSDPKRAEPLSVAEIDLPDRLREIAERQVRSGRNLRYGDIPTLLAAADAIDTLRREAVTVTPETFDEFREKAARRLGCKCEKACLPACRYASEGVY